MRVHWLSVHKDSRKAWCIKSCQQSVYHDNNVKLFVTALELAFLSSKTVIQICIISLYLANSE